MKASIISPVSVNLVVTDIPRSMDFYMNRLGFEKTPDGSPEVRSGVVRIRFHDKAGAIDGAGMTGSAEKSILFFETNDVKAMYDQLGSKGVVCSVPEKVNWIKMEMFTTSDPDGHQLWFGRSYHREYEIMHSGVPRGQARTIMPGFSCKDVPASVQYYVSALGFSVNYEQPDFAVLDRDRVRILLRQAEDKDPGKGECYIYINNADEMHDELTTRGADVRGEPVSQPWGLREFFVRDIDGNTIGLGQTFE